MGHNDSLAQLRVENAVCAFNGDQQAFGVMNSGVKRAAALGAGQKCLRFRGAGKKSPDYFFNRMRSPLALCQPQRSARLGIRKDDISRALEENEDRKPV